MPLNGIETKKSHKEPHKIFTIKICVQNMN